MHCKYPLITLLTSLSLWSCQKDSLQPNVPPPVATPKLEVLWQQPLEPDTGRYTGNAQFVRNGEVVYTINFTSPSGTVNKRNGNSGALIWSFGAFYKPTDFSSSRQVFDAQGYTLVNNWHTSYCLGHSGNLVWGSNVSEIGGGDPYAQLIGDYLYTIHYEGTNPGIKSSSIVRTHYLSGQWDTLLTIPRPDDRYGQIIRPPTLWVNQQGDSVLILRNAEVSNVLGLRNRTSLHAWNMRTKQFEWELKDFIPEGNSGVYQPVVSDNRLYINGPNAVYCISLETGSMLWERPFPAIQLTSIVQHKNSIIFCGTFEEGMWSLNKTDGSQNWYNADVIGAAYQLFYFDGVVYQTSSGSGRLYAVDAETGATIWKESSPNRKFAKTDDAGFDFQGIAIDPINRVLFTCDHYYIMCIRLPE